MNNLEGIPLKTETIPEPWRVVAALAVMPVFILLGAFIHSSVGFVIMVLGAVSCIPAIVHALRAMRKVEWPFLPAALSLFLGAIHLGFLGKFVGLAFSYLKRKYF